MNVHKVDIDMWVSLAEVLIEYLGICYVVYFIQSIIAIQCYIILSNIETENV